jgi:sugar/nucleoside kinase (ribokinase family)
MHNLVPLELVDYLVVGHIAEDITPDDVRMGGTAAYSALTARALGLKVGIVTACSAALDFEIFDGITVISLPSQTSTTFENIYSTDDRQQVLHQLAEPISFDSIPQQWRRASIIHLGPIAQEIPQVIPDFLSPSLLGLTPQGWLRGWQTIPGEVSQTTWENTDELLARAGAIVLSIEDVAGDEQTIENIAGQTRVLAVTEGSAGARLYWHGDQRRFRAPQMKEVDGTGAGDIFAAAFFFRLLATRDPWEAARFATLLSARSVSRVGLLGIPTVEEIQECLMEVF